MEIAGGNKAKNGHWSNFPQFVPEHRSSGSTARQMGKGRNKEMRKKWQKRNGNVYYIRPKEREDDRKKKPRKIKKRKKKRNVFSQKS